MAHFQLGDSEVAHNLLQDALIKFPGVLLPLMEKCGAVIDSKVASCPYFFNAKTTYVFYSFFNFCMYCEMTANKVVSKKI